MPSSTIKVRIAEILQQEGYIAGYNVEDAEVGKNLVLALKFGPTRERSIAGIKRVLQARPCGCTRRRTTCPGSSAASASRYLHL